MHKRDTPIEGRTEGPGYLRISVHEGEEGYLFRRPWPFEALELLDYVQSEAKRNRRRLEQAKDKEDPDEMARDVRQYAQLDVAIQGAVLRWLWADPVWELSSDGNTREQKGLSAVRGLIDAGWSNEELSAYFLVLLEVCTQIARKAPRGDEVDKLVNFGRAGVPEDLRTTS